MRCRRRGVLSYIADEQHLGRVLDYAVIVPRLPRLYEWSAEELAEPRLLELVRDGSPIYAWPFEQRHVWRRPKMPAAGRARERSRGRADMERASIAPAVAADAAGVTEVVAALESSLYGPSTYTQADLEEEWLELDVQRDTRVVRDGDRIVGYGAVRERGQVWRVEGHVHPDAHGRGVGRLIASSLEDDAVRGGARRIQNHVLEADSPACRLLESLGYTAVRVFREMRIELDAPPPAPEWPAGLCVTPFEPERDAREFHAASQEAFADAWDYSPRDFESWSKVNLGSERFDPALWCVVRAGDEIAAGTTCVGNTYGGGFVHALFTRRPWRKRGVGTALLRDAFWRFWERGERSVGLGVDAESDTGAFRLYERAGMMPALGWVTYEKGLV